VSAPIGFIGLGRIGLPIASQLVAAGHQVVCCKRGRSTELVREGAQIAGDGSARAVAEAAPIVFTCLSAEALAPVFEGPDGILAAEGPAPLIVEMSTVRIADKQRVRDKIAQRGGEVLDCPISGTPPMVAAKRSMIFASGDPDAYERVAPLVTAISPGALHVGGFGDGTKLKYVANLLVCAHAVAAAEAMAFADIQGLDLEMVARVISQSPGASSGQFINQTPMMAAGQFEGTQATIAETREVLSQIATAALDVGAWVPVLAVAQELFEGVGESGADEDHPAKLFDFMRQHAAASVQSEK